MALVFVFSRIKLSEKLTHVPVTWEKVKKCMPVLYTPLYMIKSFFWRFFLDGPDLNFIIGHKGEKYSLRNTSRMQNIEFVLVNFSINTTYRQPIWLIFSPLSQIYGKSWRDRKKWLSYSYSVGKKLNEYWKFIHGNFFLQASVIGNLSFNCFLLTWLNPTGRLNFLVLQTCLSRHHP